MLLRIPKRPPGSRRQRELKRTEGDKLQAGQGRAAQSTEPQLRPRSTEEPWPPQPACVKEGRGTTLPGAAGPSRHRRPPFRKHRGAARTSAARLATPQKRWGLGRRELPQRQRRARARPAAVLPAGTPRGGPWSRRQRRLCPWGRPPQLGTAGRPVRPGQPRKAGWHGRGRAATGHTVRVTFMIRRKKLPR